MDEDGEMQRENESGYCTRWIDVHFSVEPPVNAIEVHVKILKPFAQKMGWRIMDEGFEGDIWRLGIYPMDTKQYEPFLKLSFPEFLEKKVWLIKVAKNINKALGKKPFQEELHIVVEPSCDVDEGHFYLEHVWGSLKVKYDIRDRIGFEMNHSEESKRVFGMLFTDYLNKIIDEKHFPKDKDYENWVRHAVAFVNGETLPETEDIQSALGEYDMDISPINQDPGFKEKLSNLIAFASDNKRAIELSVNERRGQMERNLRIRIDPNSPDEKKTIESVKPIGLSSEEGLLTFLNGKFRKEEIVHFLLTRSDKSATFDEIKAHLSQRKPILESTLKHQLNDLKNLGILKKNLRGGIVFALFLPPNH